MFCYQCEQTRDAKGCTTIGVCGKTPEVAGLQDILVEACKSVSAYATRAYKLGAPNDRKLDNWVLGALFSTLTNVNFDPGTYIESRTNSDFSIERFSSGFLSEADAMIKKAKDLYETYAKKAGKPVEDLSTRTIPTDKLKVSAINGMSPEQYLQYIQNIASPVGVLAHKSELSNEDIHSLHELITYGLKGTAAYAHHAEVLGQESDEIYRVIIIPLFNLLISKEFHDLLDFVGSKSKDVGALLGAAMRVGQLNLKVMELLDKGSTEKYGHPVPTNVRTTAVAGKCIAVSGHDLRDLEEILKQTEGKCINVYTHGELLPAHAYPELKVTKSKSM